MVTNCKKPPRLPWGTRSQKTIWCPRAPNSVEGSLPCDRSQISREPQGIYPTLRELIDAPIAPPLSLYLAHLDSLVSWSGLTLLPETKASNLFLPSGATTTGSSITNPFQPIASYPATLCPWYCSTGLYTLQLLHRGDRAHRGFT
jgi:hypothetical protein